MQRQLNEELLFNRHLVGKSVHKSDSQKYSMGSSIIPRESFSVYSIPKIVLTWMVGPPLSMQCHHKVLDTGWLQQYTHVLHILEDGKSKMKMLADIVSSWVLLVGRTLFLGSSGWEKATFLLGPQMAERRALVPSSSVKGMNSS